jgi:gamma-glutamyltranspeptidase/glutathione hydrolase
VASGHFAATEAALRVLEEGGNAFDAAVCAGLCLNVLEPFLVGPGGEVPMLLRTADGRVRVLAGQGFAPAALTRSEACRGGVDRLLGEGLRSAVVPGALGAWLMLADELGTLPFPRLIEPAIALAEGFPVYDRLARQLAQFEERLQDRYPTTAQVYYRSGVLTVGERLGNPALARFYRRLSDAGSPARAAALIYDGPIGRELVGWTGARGGLLTLDDLRAWRPRFEEPVTRTYRGVRVHKAGPWSQAPVFLQQLALLERFDEVREARRDASWWHLWIECSKLAFADREGFYGDPDFVHVPLDRLLSDAYTGERAAQVDLSAASLELRPGEGAFAPLPYLETQAPAVGDPEAAGPHAGWGPPTGDTTHLDVADRFGNVLAATPSGGWAQSSPMIPELGFCLTTRAQMFHLVPGHPNAPAPRKRPRTTLTPSLAELPDGSLLAFGTPGGDCQDQWSLQAFLGVVDGGMSLHEACNAPALQSAHVPNSFWPREARPGVVVVEGDLPRDVIDGLRERGHRVEVGPPRSQGRVSFVRRAADGALEAAISRRHGHPEVGAIES